MRSEAQVHGSLAVVPEEKQRVEAWQAKVQVPKWFENGGSHSRVAPPLSFVALKPRSPGP